ncbi:MAG: hypothetical protein BJ554DRAFT_885 [Olpidium bornovanus]|uniref:Pre-mRNA-processing protein 45 n=1 Tax=Olpidium bornovanus TaxID=278681 RepID=A0A8H7ZSK2_9FUNG|nr:MAG: hypothetical protein BJ554DRAFT_885 [Olpidium bornovanus]
MQQKLAAKEKAIKEENLRMLAQRAREERSGFMAAISTPSAASTTATGLKDAPVGAPRPLGSRSPRPSGGERERLSPPPSRRRSRSVDSEASASGESGDDAGRRKEAGEELERRRRERDEIRRDRQRQREREIRMSRMGNDAKARYAAREADRSVSEKIALGIAKPTLSKDSMFDQRLFNQSEGISSGFKDDEAYTVYDKALFSAQAASAAIYRPKRSGGGAGENDLGDEEAIDKLLSNDRFGGSGLAVKRGFQGADGSAAARRDGPVQFEKEVEEFDPFGHDEFLSQAKKGKRGLDRSAAASGRCGGFSSL